MIHELHFVRCGGIAAYFASRIEISQRNSLILQLPSPKIAALPEQVLRRAAAA